MPLMCLVTEMKNRDGYDVEVSPIKSVDLYEEGGCAITRDEPGWGTFGLTAAELNGFVPQVGDIVIVYTQGFSSIRGVVIDGHTFRYQTPAAAKEEHEQWKKNWRLEKLERYVKHGEELKARAAALPLPLRERMERFVSQAENEVDFWVDDAPYEMAALSGSAALLRKVQELEFISDVDYPSEGSDTEGAVKWIEDWWDINSEKHGYDYKRQMEIVPDFGDGHSGNTAGAAKGLAVLILKGESV